MATLQNVRDKVDYEGFDYALRNWSFEDVDDPEFHRLRKLYVEASDALDNYLHLQEDEE